MLLFIFGLILFIGLVVVHEFGHFIMARRNGVEIEEFGIGFPPRLWKKRIHSKKGDYNFTINLLPLGGFVKMKGEHDSDTEKGTFGAANTWAKTKIMAAGVVMNLITAFLLLTLLAAIGMPKIIDNQYTVPADTKTVKNDIIISFVEKDSPASKAGLQQGDMLEDIKLAGTDADASVPRLEDSSDLPKLTKLFAGKKVELTYARDGQIKQGTAIIR
ncbi:MAG TPA: site-2 protease family protein, partial [Hymenobacter sp.]